MNNENESFPSSDTSDLPKSEIEEIKKYAETGTEEENEALGTELKKYSPNVLQKFLEAVRSLWSFTEASIPTKMLLKLIKDRKDKHSER